MDCEAIWEALGDTAGKSVGSGRVVECRLVAKASESNEIR